MELQEDPQVILVLAGMDVRESLSLSQVRWTDVGQQHVSVLVRLFWTEAPLLHRHNQQEVIITVSLRRISLKCSGQKLWTITSAGSGRWSQDKQLHRLHSSWRSHRAPAWGCRGHQPGRTLGSMKNSKQPQALLQVSTDSRWRVGSLLKGTSPAPN